MPEKKRVQATNKTKKKNLIAFKLEIYDKVLFEQQQFCAKGIKEM
jgi:hypothetical protein